MAKQVSEMNAAAEHDHARVQSISRAGEEQAGYKPRAEGALALDRLRSLGLLAGGITHEINNPLSFLIGNLELAELMMRELEARLGPADAFTMVGIRQLMERVHRGAERIATATRSVSMFVDTDTEEIVSVDVVEVLERSIQMVSNELRHRARLERSLLPIARVTGNAAKLSQVFLNLLTYAMHTSAEVRSKDPLVRVTTETLGGDMAVVTISNIAEAGPVFGLIPDDSPLDQPHSLAPGLGLGLTISRQVISAMGGTLDMESVPQHGICFRVSLPGIPDTSFGLRAVSSRPAALSSVANAPARILVIDDETMICDLLKVMLGDMYQVEVLSNPREALARLHDGEPYDLILCDLMMPQLSGMELYTEIARIRPEQAARVVFMTGGTFTQEARDFLSSTRRYQLRKPFRRLELLDAVRVQLESQNASQPRRELP